MRIVKVMTGTTLKIFQPGDVIGRNALNANLKSVAVVLPHRRIPTEHQQIAADLNISRQKKGRIAELKVRADLMLKGWDLFVPEVEDHHYDIIAMKNNKTRILQVKTSWSKSSGTSVQFKLQKHFKNKYIDYYAFWIKPIDKVVYFKAKDQKTISVAFEKSYHDKYLNRNHWKNFTKIS